MGCFMKKLKVTQKKIKSYSKYENDVNISFFNFHPSKPLSNPFSLQLTVWNLKIGIVTLISVNMPSNREERVIQCNKKQWIILVDNMALYIVGSAKRSLLEK